MFLAACAVRSNGKFLPVFFAKMMTKANLSYCYLNSYKRNTILKIYNSERLIKNFSKG